ncbi:MAG: hypothetical protein J6386_20460 [Candidatus Synoicihabitans palmerolidicus]|nr:hypothetical protein [Candidatus Synoicihabitans palmerolidicus]
MRPKIIVEPLLKEPGNAFPTDYKFFVFHDRCEFVQIDIDRGTSHRRELRAPNWTPLPVTHYHTTSRVLNGPRPERFDEMRSLAEQLAAGFDHLRVDLYLINGEIRIGEMTCYPAGGLSAIVPNEFDYRWESYWQLTPSRRASKVLPY